MGTVVFRYTYTAPVMN